MPASAPRAQPRGPRRCFARGVPCRAELARRRPGGGCHVATAATPAALSPDPLRSTGSSKVHIAGHDARAGPGGSPSRRRVDQR